LQIPFLLQYIVLYFLGVKAFRGNWLEKIAGIRVRFWITLTLVLVVLMPILFFLSGGAQGDVSLALGDIHRQSLALSVWEQLFCTCIILLVLYFFQKYAIHHTKITNKLAASAYGAFIIHPLILVLLTTSLNKILLHPLLKISTLAIPGLALCFLGAGLFRRLPGFMAIL